MLGTVIGSTGRANGRDGRHTKKRALLEDEHLPRVSTPLTTAHQCTWPNVGFILTCLPHAECDRSGWPLRLFQGTF